MVVNEYELLVILKPDLDEAKFKKALSGLKTSLEKEGASFKNEEDWGKRRLAYRIKKWEEGHYVLLRFASELSRLKSIRKILKFDEAVIRYLVTKVGVGLSGAPD